MSFQNHMRKTTLFWITCKTPGINLPHLTHANNHVILDNPQTTLHQPPNLPHLTYAKNHIIHSVWHMKKKHVLALNPIRRGWKFEGQSSHLWINQYLFTTFGHFERMWVQKYWRNPENYKEISTLIVFSNLQHVFDPFPVWCLFSGLDLIHIPSFTRSLCYPR